MTDGGAFINYITEDGLAHDSVFSICKTAGAMWFGTQGGGVSRFDGQTFKNYTTADGLADNMIWSIVEDDDGHLWFSCFESGVCRFDGEAFTRFTIEDGLAHDNVWYMLKDRGGQLWFGTWGGGVSRFDGQTFKNYTTVDGLVDNNVRSIFEDRDGRLWFGTYGGGVSVFDGQVFQTIALKDGLVHDAVQHVDQAADGAMWIATEGGVSRYTPLRKNPTVHLRDVVADRRYGPDAIVLSASQHLVAFEFQGASFTTAPDQFAYVYLQGVDDDWHTTYQRRVEYRDLAPGDYRFEVRAVDRDLNYSGRRRPLHRRPRRPAGLGIDALEAELSQPHGLEQFIGQSPRAKNHPRPDPHGGGHRRDGADPGRDRHRQGPRRPRHPRAVQAPGRAPDPGQLRRHSRGPGRIRALRPREGRLHRRPAARSAASKLADGGTLFLDEIGDLPLESQQVLLHVLQDGTFQRVGGDRTIGVDVRVVAATNRDLRDAMRAGTFREDLYFRLSAFALHLPPARKPRGRALLLHTSSPIRRHLNRPVPAIDPEVLIYLQQYGWPGNVRELEQLALHAVLVCRDDRIGPGRYRGARNTPPQDPRRRPTSPDPRGRYRPLEEQEIQLIEQALRASNGIVYGERGPPGSSAFTPNACALKSANTA